jgi:flavin-binding protein dodecin
MANTTNQGWAKPTIGGSEDTWGQTVNDAIDAIDTLVGSVTAAEVAKLDGLTASTAELNYSAGVTSAIQPQLDAIEVIPSGVIMLWSGAADAVPANYVLCDGANSTPDLRNRFVVGAGSTYAVGATGGSADAIVVDHTHTGTTNTTGSHAHTASTWSPTSDNIHSGFGAGKSPQKGTKSTNSAGDHSHTLNVDSTGSSGTNANLPPYYALCYIMKT